jgi:hypothetical protein
MEAFEQERESSEAERQPSGNSEVPPKSNTITNLTRKNRFSNSVAKLSSKTETNKRIVRHNVEILKNKLRHKFYIFSGSS